MPLGIKSATDFIRVALELSWNAKKEKKLQFQPDCSSVCSLCVSPVFPARGVSRVESIVGIVPFCSWGGRIASAMTGLGHTDRRQQGNPSFR